MQDLCIVSITRWDNTVQALHTSLKWTLKCFTADYTLFIPVRMLWRAGLDAQEAATDEQEWKMAPCTGKLGQEELRGRGKVWQPVVGEYVGCDEDGAKYWGFFQVSAISCELCVATPAASLLTGGRPCILLLFVSSCVCPEGSSSAAPLLVSNPAWHPWSWWQCQVCAGAQGGEHTPGSALGCPCCPWILPSPGTNCAASHGAAKIPHPDSITLCSHCFTNRNCPFQLFRVAPKGKCMFCSTLLLSASGTSNLFSCQHWFIKQHTETQQWLVLAYISLAKQTLICLLRFYFQCFALL